MTPWVELDRAAAPGGGELVLSRRGGEFVIRVDGRELMGSHAHGSEERLADRGCAGLSTREGTRVLVGGLGMGFTLRAALRHLPQDARLDVVELIPAVVQWNRGPLAHLASSPLNDPRVRVVEGDVTTVMAASSGTFDAILLDVDNGPSSLTAPANARLYDAAGLARAARALRPGGTLAIWSASDDVAFTERMKSARFDVQVERVSARGATGRRHVLWIARRSIDRG